MIEEKFDMKVDVKKRSIFYLKSFVLGKTWSCIWWWGSSSGTLESLEYLFATITPKSTLTPRDNTC